MEGKKTIKNIIILLICISALALISINIYNHQQNSKISQNGNYEVSASGEPDGNMQPGSQNPTKTEHEEDSFETNFPNV